MEQMLGWAELVSLPALLHPQHQDQFSCFARARSDQLPCVPQHSHAAQLCVCVGLLSCTHALRAGSLRAAASEEWSPTFMLPPLG